MIRSLRILPMTMLMAFLLLGLKVGEVMRDGRMLVLSFSEAKAEPDAKATEKPADTAKSDVPKKDASDKKDGEPKVNPPSTQSDDTTADQEPPKHEFSQVEVDLLESLAKRRQDLDDWAKQVQLKENMLVATEQRINGKIDALQKVKKQVEDLLAQYNEQEDIKIRSLVKIYENMKPKDAARIFEELDMPVLLMVVDRMNDRKVAPVLAAMNPTKAKDVTVQLAEQRKLQKNRPSTSPAADASASPTADTASTDNAPPATGSNTGSPAAAATPGDGSTGSPASSTPADTSPAAPPPPPPAAAR